MNAVLLGKVAIVTGGSRGIGRAVALRLATDGADVVVASRSLDAASAVSTLIHGMGRRALSVAADISREDDVDRLITTVLNHFGQIDILVHSAGLGMQAAFVDTERSDWDRIISVNLTGTFLVTQRAARHMLSRNYGRIVTLASVSAERAGMGRSAYAASKGGVISLTKTMAVELAPFGITANVISPGPIETDMTMHGHSKETRAAFIMQTPAHRYGLPEDVAATAAYLVSPEAAHVTGHILHVDGGFMAAGAMMNLDQ